jgi:MFS family permease
LTTDATPQPAPRVSALAEPTAKVGGKWVTYWTLAMSGMYMAYYAAAQILLPQQAQQVDAQHKVAVVAVVTGVASLVTLVITIAVGLLSDRTLATRGRRQIWVLAGAVIAGISVAGQGFAASVIGMVLVWAIANVGISAMTGALFAAVPDEVPTTQRATVSSFYGISVSAGPLVGIALVSLAITGVLPGFVALGVLLLLFALPFCFGTKGIPLHREERPPLSAKAVLVGLVQPLRHADFAWAWSGRFFIQLSNAFAQVYLFYYLQDYVHYPNPEGGTFVLVLVYTIAAVAITVPAGRLSDRTMKRKRMVVVSSALQGMAGLIMAFVPTFPAAIVAALVLGLGYGTYASVDQALVTQVLPAAADRGKDLGVINVANQLPYLLTGLIGGLVISAFGYPTLMVLVLVTALIAAATVFPIKSVA